MNRGGSAMLLRTTVMHRCPVCGHPKRNSMGQGWVQRTAHCQQCGSDYTLTRDMHTPGVTWTAERETARRARKNRDAVLHVSTK